MEWIKHTESAREILKKYGYVVLILMLGVFLMCLPEKEETASTIEKETPETHEDMESSLQRILSMVDGAGKVAVLLTEGTGEEYLYQTDEERHLEENSSRIHRKTVMTTNASRDESGLLRQVNPPKLRGAVVVCQGADDPKVKLAVVEAVMKATGLSTNSICVLKMK